MACHQQAIQIQMSSWTLDHFYQFKLSGLIGLRKQKTIFFFFFFFFFFAKAHTCYIVPDNIPTLDDLLQSLCSFWIPDKSTA